MDVLLRSHETRYIRQRTDSHHWVPYEDRNALFKVGSISIFLSYGKKAELVETSKMIVKPKYVSCQGTNKMSVIKWRI